MRIPFYIVLCLALIAVVYTTLHADDQVDGAVVVQNVCGNCHAFSRLCSNLGKDEAWWVATSTRMISNFAPINAAEAEAAGKHLAGLKPGDKFVCGK